MNSSKGSFNAVIPDKTARERGRQMYGTTNRHTKPVPTQPLVTMVTREMVHSKYVSHTLEDTHTF